VNVILTEFLIQLGTEITRPQLWDYDNVAVSYASIRPLR